MDKTVHVEIVGSEPGLFGIPSFIFIALAALGAALVAAGVAVWRMKKQLAHDRQMRNRDDARRTVYDAMDGCEGVLNTVLEFENAVRELQRAIEQNADEEEIVAAKRSTATEAESAAHDARTAVILHSVRLQTRLETSKLADAADVVYRDYGKQMALLAEGVTGTLTAEDWAEIAAIDRRTTSCLSAFSWCCSLWFNERFKELEEQDLEFAEAEESSLPEVGQQMDQARAS